MLYGIIVYCIPKQYSVFCCHRRILSCIMRFCILRANRARNGPRGYAHRRRRGEVFLYGRLGVRRLKGEGERVQKTVNRIKESVRKHNNNIH